VSSWIVPGSIFVFLLLFVVVVCCLLLFLLFLDVFCCFGRVSSWIVSGNSLTFVVFAVLEGVVMGRFWTHFVFSFLLLFVVVFFGFCRFGGCRHGSVPELFLFVVVYC